MNQPSPLETTAPASISAGEQTAALLVFKLAGQEYGLPIACIVRIIEMVALTHLPGVPETIQGLINLHGQPVPVMDLRRRFNLSLSPYGLRTPIILGDLGHGQLLGLIVDSVEDVLALTPGQIEPIPSLVFDDPTGELAPPSAYLAGVVKIKQRMILTLNLAALLSRPEQAALAGRLPGGHFPGGSVPGGSVPGGSVPGGSVLGGR